MGLSRTLRAPYYAVIFSSRRTNVAPDGYDHAAQRMIELAAQQPGFLGVESARGADGFGITVSYWESLEAIQHWRENPEHRVVQERGRTLWYERYQLRITRVERSVSFP